MKWLLFTTFLSLAFFSCDYFRQKSVKNSNRFVLRNDSLNVVKLGDTLLILEYVCRACAYEESTNFVLLDSLNLVKLHHIETYDNNSELMTGGTINKNLVIVTNLTGTTSVRVYTFLKPPTTKEDSSNYTTYNIKITN